MTKRNDAQNSPKRKRGPGRPTIFETKGDPFLVEKGTEMRLLGYSWSRIASELGVGKTTIRRYVRAYQKEKGSQMRGEVARGMPKTSDNRSGINRNQCLSFQVKENVLDGLPKSFRIFLSLVRRAREM